MGMDASQDGYPSVQLRFFRRAFHGVTHENASRSHRVYVYISEPMTTITRTLQKRLEFSIKSSDLSYCS
ncbi:uncharacterized protein FOMMEDRAFT_18883 [Fomitiporia mediterranea MF3/22]|uniref:uncharacterized protein n=1 Tax=Fomitiporia mediterranea (strain MF3/22) TaxID=694068 RepID=UPI00044092B0|nr:uncharacterized protein FOMMEDRAFT_18883 [Fomitiporia mediterranea MF3/22]EJD05284.1 hypothetical protein FOMMEDRAFT_18883 [Fomitiporia mediterranea MF3/22]